MAFVDNTHEWCTEGVTPEIDNLQGVPAEVASTWIEAFERDEHVFIRSVDRIPDDEADLREILAEQDIQFGMPVKVAFIPCEDSKGAFMAPVAQNAPPMNSSVSPGRKGKITRPVSANTIPNSSA